MGGNLTPKEKEQSQTQEIASKLERLSGRYRLPTRAPHVNLLGPTRERREYFATEFRLRIYLSAFPIPNPVSSIQYSVLVQFLIKHDETPQILSMPTPNMIYLVQV